MKVVTLRRSGELLVVAEHLLVKAAAPANLAEDEKVSAANLGNEHNANQIRVFRVDSRLDWFWFLRVIKAM